MSESKSSRGGARKGAGRPKSEPTVMVRVPAGCLDEVRTLIKLYRGLNECSRLLGVEPGGQTDFDDSVKSNLRSDMDEYNQMIADSIDL